MTRPRRIGAAIADVRAAAQPQTLLAAVQQAWPNAAGDRIAAEAEPTAERDGTVTVSCRAGTWAEELDLLHDELLERLNAVLAQAARAGASARPAPERMAVRRLRFTAAGVS